MAEAKPPERAVAPACRWRSSSETVDVIEALERIEALLIRLDDRLRALEPREERSPEAARSVS
jgi:hypothetical protein